MKIIISESQYKLLFEDNKVEFPGFSFFGGDLDMIESLLDDFVIDGKPINSLKDIFIHEIKLKVEQEDGWIDLIDSLISIGDWYISSLQPDGVYLIRYIESDDKNEDEWTNNVDEEYKTVSYEKLSIDELRKIYTFL